MAMNEHTNTRTQQAKSAQDTGTASKVGKTQHQESPTKSAHKSTWNSQLNKHKIATGPPGTAKKIST